MKNNAGQLNTIKNMKNIESIPYSPILIAVGNSERLTIIDGVKRLITTYIYCILKNA